MQCVLHAQRIYGIYTKNVFNSVLTESNICA